MSTQDSLTRFYEALERAESAISSVLDGTSHELDLNALQASLAEAREACEMTVAPVTSMENELGLLQVDLAGRIMTMIRAINVARDKRSPESETALTEEIANSSAESLLRLYRRVCVRFRDTFPGSLRYLATGAASHQDWSEFKSE